MKSVFTSHVYRYKGKYYLQGDRGPIGHLITCTVARLVMIWFNQKFLALIAALGLTMYVYLRYIDDINAILKKIKKNTYFDKVKKILVYNEEADESDMKNDEEMMSMLNDIANSVTSMIKWEADCPSRHMDGQLPALDVKLHIDEEDRRNPVKLKFYQKQVVTTKADQIPKPSFNCCL